MKTNEEKIKMRKRNMKIFPIYKALGWDYLFYYTIDFLFLTQIKNISAANVILMESCYSFFSIIMQIPTNIIIGFLGRKNSIIFGNILNCVYMSIFLFSRNLSDLIFAAFIKAIAFSIKNASEPSLLGESIPPSRYKGLIYSKLNSKGAAGFYALNAISKILAGVLFYINGYMPILFSLIILIIATILSIGFIEPVRTEKVKLDAELGIKQIKETQKGFVYILKSDRLKALILYAGLVAALLSIARTYHVSLLEDLNISSIAIGIIAAIGSLVSSIASKNQQKFHKKMRNKSLMTIAFMLSISCIIAGIFGKLSEMNIIFIIFIIVSNISFYFCNGMYYILTDRYLSNFTNKNIDTKIFSAQQMFSNTIKAVGGMFSAFIMDRLATAICMIIMGAIFTILYLLLGKYMKTRVGLKPEQYTDEEKKYDQQKLIEERIK